MSDSAIHSAAGALGGIVAMTATYPLVFLSTRAAVETKKANKSTKTAILEILEREGFFGLYAGLNSSLLGIAVTNGIYYYFYERTKGALLSSRNGTKALTTVESMLTGAIAGVVTSTLANPLWVIQTTQATQTMADSAHLGPNSVSPPKKKSMNIIETLRFILQKDGITALWRGLGPALVLVSNPVIQYTVFEQLKNALVRRRTEVLRATGVATAAVLSDWDFFLLGALSKLVATGFTYPYLVVKSRLQAGHSSAAQYKSTYHGLLTIIRAEGLSGLYKGIGSKLLQSVLTAAILFASQRRLYELTKKIVQPVKAI